MSLTPRWIGIFAHSEIEVGGAKITFFETLHEVHCLAVRIEFGGKKMVNTSDSQYSEELIGFSSNADILIIKTSFYKEFDASKFGHMNTVDVATIAQRAQVKKAVLTHLPHFGELERLVSEVEELYDGDVVLAHKGLTLTCYLRKITNLRHSLTRTSYCENTRRIFMSKWA